jgi:hypothetical protein
VIFNFADSAGSSNGTSMSSGQVPEIYYYVWELNSKYYFNWLCLWDC